MAEAMRHVGDGVVDGDLGVMAVNYTVAVRKGKGTMTRHTLVNGLR